jgi:hypothetical protein
MQGELQIALLETAFGIFGFPSAAVPQHDRAAAVLALRNRALEITIVERVVFDLDGQPLVVRIERGPFRHRPGLEDAVEFEPQIVVQPRGVMLLDHEAPLLRWHHRRLARRLRRLLEITFLSILGELLQHDWSRILFGMKAYHGPHPTRNQNPAGRLGFQTRRRWRTEWHRAPIGRER